MALNLGDIITLEDSNDSDPDRIRPIQIQDNRQIQEIAHEWVQFAIHSHRMRYIFVDFINSNELYNIILFEDMVYDWIIHNTDGYISKLNLFVLPNEDSTQKIQLFINKWQTLDDYEKISLINNNKNLKGMNQSLIQLKYLKYLK